MKEFAERLKYLRQEQNLTQQQLAANTGLSKTAICYWEQESRTPSAEAVVILARYFHVTTDYLLGESD